MLNILFLCTGNSCRSQMAEGWTKYLKSAEIQAYSAGVEAHGKNPLAIQAMKEAGVDISAQKSKTTEQLPADVVFDYVITVCGHAHERCPYFPAGTKVIHVGFQDPPYLAKEAATKEEALVHYRKVRDDIKTFVEKMPQNLSEFS
ncbi:MAG: arsenate reductase ArsC [Desulfovibrio sp.]